MKKYLWTLMVLLLGISQAGAEGVNKDAYKTAVFAGGCFWCIESDFEKLEGVIDVESGYTGGERRYATYSYVSKGVTKHIEAVEVTYDSDRIKYSDLLEYFWRHIDPLDGGGQFCDRGNQYRSAVFYKNDEQKQLIEKSKIKVEEVLGSKVETVITKETAFYPAENYHQGYYKEKPIRYKYYRKRCGRDKRVKELWATPNK